MIMNMLLMGAAAAATPATVQAGPPADLDAWVTQVNRLLQRHLSMPRGNDRGVATVTFRRDENGRPMDVVVRSGSPFISNAATATIRSIKMLPPMPPMMPSNQRITFKLLIGDESHVDEFERARVAVLGSAKQSNLALAAKLGSAAQLADLSRR